MKKPGEEGHSVSLPPPSRSHSSSSQQHPPLRTEWVNPAVSGPVTSSFELCGSVTARPLVMTGRGQTVLGPQGAGTLMDRWARLSRRCPSSKPGFAPPMLRELLEAQSPLVWFCVTPNGARGSPIPPHPPSWQCSGDYRGASIKVRSPACKLCALVL